MEAQRRAKVVGDTNAGWFPFIRVRIDPEITAVIGSNEAGKTQLLSATESAMTGVEIDPRDFCRYSVFYSAQQGEIRSPEFGAEYVSESPDEVTLVRTWLPDYELGESFTILRPGDASAFIIYRDTRVDTDDMGALLASLPSVFKVDTSLRMPDSMSIIELAGKRTSRIGRSRRRRRTVVQSIESTKWSTADEFGSSLFPLWKTWSADADTEREKRRRDEFELGRKLLVEIARIAPESFVRLQQAIDEEKEGEIEGLVGAMNRAIAENLNFQRWWTQDTNFDLQVKAREQELALVIRDRTKASYSFDERSQGLRYFLSYYVQLEAHKATSSGDEVMLLDEPDAFLSNQGQQDLLKVLQEYARPESGAAKRQVLYVTHSPFLIDRNAGHRIRVLDKGAEDEGTRVVRDATQNHYEPLRTSLGTVIAETAFVGGKNLFVEGLADQVLIAGVATRLARAGGPLLDLNQLTIVPANGASSVAYLVYLARGRGGPLPPSVALFDGDSSGRQGAKVLRDMKAGRRHVLASRYIVTLDEWASTAVIELSPGVIPREPEDLIPVELAADAAKRVARTFAGDERAKLVSAEGVAEQLGATKTGSLWEALSSHYSAVVSAELDKVAFAREIVESMATSDDSRAIKAVEANFSALLTHLSDLLDEAENAERLRRGADRVGRVVDGFLRDHPEGATRRRARSLLRELEQSLDDTALSDHLRIEISAIDRDFGLDGNLLGPLEPFGGFRESLERLKRIKDGSAGLASSEVKRRTAN